MHLAGPTCDFTSVLDALLVAVGSHGVAVAELVVAGVGPGRGHTGTETAGLGATFSNMRLVAGGSGHVSTVGELVIARFLGCQRGISGSGYLGTGHRCHGSSNAAHVGSSLESDESVFSPVGSPAVLDEPVVLTIICSVAHHSNGMIGISRWRAAGKYSSLVLLEGALGLDGSNNSSVFVDQLFHQLFISTVGVVGVTDVHTLTNNQDHGLFFVVFGF